jgi:uracil-DNA glycosylase family protein
MKSKSKPAKKKKSSGPLERISVEAEGCRRCPLWEHATQTVFGSGSANGPLMFVGEQPGDVEDRQGEPFVGPAGQLLRRALGEAGIEMASVYLTNTVKHFKWRRQGKRRLHERPNHEEVMACRLWLDMEIEAVRPAVLVALGATAAGALLGPSVRVTKDRGRKLVSTLAPLVTVTVHPSSILRSTDAASRARAYEQFVTDLRRIAAWVKSGGR